MVPALVKLQVPLIAAHLFAFYFANLANITPPVALAAYAAAGIADDDAFKTGIQAFKLGLAAYIVPFMFIFNTNLLLLGDNYWELIGAIITSLVGVFFLAAASENWLITKTSLLERVMLFAASIFLIYPGILTDSLGFGLGGIVLLVQYIKFKKVNTESINLF